MVAFIVKLLKNGLLLNGIIDYTTYWHQFDVFSKEKVILHFEFQSLFLEYIKLF